MNPRPCKRCGKQILDGYVEGVVPTRLDRRVITREEAEKQREAGRLVVGLLVRRGEVRESVFWYPRHDDRWRPVLEHSCNKTERSI